MKYDKISRRLFLEGLGSAALGVPAIGSLLPKAVQAAIEANPQFNFIAFTAQHGGIQFSGPKGELLPPTINPNVKGLDVQLPGWNFLQEEGRHRIHWKSIRKTINESSSGQLSNIIDSRFNPYAEKMLIANGFDNLYWHNSHNRSMLGNLGQVTSKSDHPDWGWGGFQGLPQFPSIDQMLVNSDKFYRDPYLRNRDLTFVFGNQRASTQHFNPSTTWNDLKNRDPKNGFKTNNKYLSHDPLTTFKNQISILDVSDEEAEKKLFKAELLDKVLPDYKEARGSRKLGKQDRYKLDRHIASVEQTLQDLRRVAGACSTREPAGLGASENIGIYKAFNSVMVNMIDCGVGHSFVCPCYTLSGSNSQDWHDWAHGGNGARNYRSEDSDGYKSSSYYKSKREHSIVIQDIIFDLLEKLGDRLDNTVIMWIPEHGISSHLSTSVPTVFFGGKNTGELNLGNMVDYRDLESPWTYFNRDSKRFVEGHELGGEMWKGYPLNQLWANIMQVMGLQREDYEQYNYRYVQDQEYFTKGPTGKGSGYGHLHFYWRWDPEANYGKGAWVDTTDFKSGQTPGYRSWKSQDLSAKLPIFRT